MPQKHITYEYDRDFLPLERAPSWRRRALAARPPRSEPLTYDATPEIKPQLSLELLGGLRDNVEQSIGNLNMPYDKGLPVAKGGGGSSSTGEHPFAVE